MTTMHNRSAHADRNPRKPRNRVGGGGSTRSTNRRPRPHHTQAVALPELDTIPISPIPAIDSFDELGLSGEAVR